MWFLFGFITILTFSIYFGWQRLLAGWKGKRQTTHGIDWEYRVDNGKYGPVAYRIGIAGPSGLAFTLKPEKGASGRS